MRPGEKREVELRMRFGVNNGRFYAHYRYKNLNWYLSKDQTHADDEMEWFCYGDIQEEDIRVLQDKLEDGEALCLGWKELPPGEFHDDFFGNGGGVWLMFNKDEVIFDRRRNEMINQPKVGQSE